MKRSELSFSDDFVLIRGSATDAPLPQLLLGSHGVELQAKAELNHSKSTVGLCKTWLRAAVTVHVKAHHPIQISD